MFDSFLIKMEISFQELMTFSDRTASIPMKEEASTAKHNSVLGTIWVISLILEKIVHISINAVKIESERTMSQTMAVNCSVQFNFLSREKSLQN